MSSKLNVQDLVTRSKEGRVSADEIREVANILASGQGGPDTYSLLYVIGRAVARDYEALVAGFLEYSKDPIVARLALQILCRFWGLTDRYRDVVAKFLQGVDWDYLGDVRAVAITAAGDFLVNNRDCTLLHQLIRLSDPAHEEEDEQRFAIEAIAVATGQSLKEALSPDKGSLTWEEWAEGIRSRGKERFASECGSSAKENVSF